jgi:hypothetical protein
MRLEIKKSFILSMLIKGASARVSRLVNNPIPTGAYNLEVSEIVLASSKYIKCLFFVVV